MDVQHHVAFAERENGVGVSGHVSRNFKVFSIVSAVGLAWRDAIALSGMSIVESTALA